MRKLRKYSVISTKQRTQKVHPNQSINMNNLVLFEDKCIDSTLMCFKGTNHFVDAAVITKECPVIYESTFN